MSVDWNAFLLQIGVQAGFLFLPVIQEFAQNVVRGAAEDYVKGCFSNVFSKIPKSC